MKRLERFTFRRDHQKSQNASSSNDFGWRDVSAKLHFALVLSISIAAAVSSPSLARQANHQNKTEAGLAKLAPSDRFQQVCDIELMERLRREGQPYNKPDSVIAYALGDPTINGDMLKGDGGAFRSAGVWYQYSFSCSATPDRMKVLSLDFKVGQAVPRDEWDAHGLSIH